jgi:hypothetical protein
MSLKVESSGIRIRCVILHEEAKMQELLTIEEIEARYAPEWVLIGEPQTDEALKLRAGQVLFHSPEQDEVCRKAAEFPPGRYALRFLGTIPQDLVLVF